MIFYFLLKLYCRCALWFYFEKWQVQNKKAIPAGPIIFVANHQNAFLDAVLVGCSSPRNPWFLARANVFNKRWAQIALDWLKMKPVYRFRDGFHSLRKSDQMIDSCVTLLKQNKSILIFAEGNHDTRWSLRPLQKGFARIAIAAEEQNINIKIIPVGLQYESHDQSGSRVLVSFGTPISVSARALTNTNAKERIDFLITQTSESIRSLILHIDPIAYNQYLYSFQNSRTYKSDLVEQLKIDQMAIANLGITKTTAETKKQRKRIELTPIYFYKQVNHFLPKSLIAFLVKKTVQDPQFIGSLKFAFGMVIVPFFYALQTGLIYFLSASKMVSFFYFISLPLSYKASVFFALANGQRKNSPAIGPGASSANTT
jgi:1-acyl-sn-glycerol-3-phosphate acyltransferase